jgi:hypothetical protein
MQRGIGLTLVVASPQSRSPCADKASGRPGCFVCLDRAARANGHAGPPPFAGVRCVRVRKALTKSLISETNAQYAQRGLLMHAGISVDTTIIAAPRSSIDLAGVRGPEVQQAKKRNQ